MGKEGCCVLLKKKKKKKTDLTGVGPGGVGLPLVIPATKTVLKKKKKKNNSESNGHLVGGFCGHLLVAVPREKALQRMHHLDLEWESERVLRLFLH